MVENTVRVIKFTVFPSKKGGALVLGGDVVVAPFEKRFDVVHVLKIGVLDIKR